MNLQYSQVDQFDFFTYMYMYLLFLNIHPLFVFHVLTLNEIVNNIYRMYD